MIKVGRPHFLIIGLVLFMFGAGWAALSGAPINLPRLALGATVVILSQLSVSYSNDYFDLAVDQPGSATLFSGGSGVLAVTPQLRQAVFRIALALIAGSLISGAAFLWIFSIPAGMMLFVILGNLAGWYYSAPPLRLSERGLGELCAALSLGFLVPGMGYLSVQGNLEGNGALVLVPLCLYSLASILVVELPDLEVDLAGGKKTWVVRWGRRFIFGLIGSLFLGGTLYFLLVPGIPGTKMTESFQILKLLSLIPLAAGLTAFLKRPMDRGRVVRYATWIFTSLLIFALLADACLVYLSAR